MQVISRHKGWLFALILLGGAITWWRTWWTWRESSQDKPILAAARRAGVHPALVKAVVWRESRFNPHARGGAGEIGLMQINKLAAQEWAEAQRLSFFYHRQLTDPAKNTQCGAWYLRKLLDRYAATDAPAVYALADYNAGRVHVLRWNKGAAATNSTAFLRQMDYPGTREYIRSILKRYAHYRRTFPPKDR